MQCSLILNLERIFLVVEDNCEVLNLLVVLRRLISHRWRRIFGHSAVRKAVDASFDRDRFICFHCPQTSFPHCDTLVVIICRFKAGQASSRLDSSRCSLYFADTSLYYSKRFQSSLLSLLSSSGKSSLFFEVDSGYYMLSAVTVEDLPPDRCLQISPALPPL